MIINKYGHIVVLAGETFEYDGDVYRCEVYKKAGLTDNTCTHCSLAPFGEPCMALACCKDERIDEEYVVFVKQEGGEDESK